MLLLVIVAGVVYRILATLVAAFVEIMRLGFGGPPQEERRTPLINRPPILPHTSRRSTAGMRQSDVEFFRALGLPVPIDGELPSNHGLEAYVARLNRDAARLTATYAVAEATEPPPPPSPPLRRFDFGDT